MYVWDYEAVGVQQEIRAQVRSEHLANRVWAQRDVCARPLDRVLAQLQCSWSALLRGSPVTCAC